MEKYIKTSIKSIQFQTFKDIEIIAVNDFSSDKSLEILKKLSSEDKRIKIINNNRNHGLLYSRTMGILNSKGEYLMNLDPDDSFKGKYSLEVIYNKAKSRNVDILSFGTFFQVINKKVFKCSHFDEIIFQPKIFESTFDSIGNLNDFLIWNKLIRRELFIKAYELFMSQVYKKYWNFHDDNIWSILVKKYAQSMLCSKKVIYIYKDNDDSLMKKFFSQTNLINLLYKHKMFEKIFTGQNEKKYLIAEKNDLISIFKNIKNDKNLTEQNDLKSKYIKIFISELKDNNNLSTSAKNIIEYFWKNSN